MSIPVTIKLKKEVVELAEKMVKYGIAKSRSHAINLMIEHGIEKVIKELESWERLRKDVEELKRSNYRIKHGGLSALLSEERSQR
ncbi:MAG: hypothetical protein QXI36_01960 [Candidatus Bathyarchaeia archaeon]